MANQATDPASAPGAAGALALGDLASRVGGELTVGDAFLSLSGVATLDDAGPGELSFITRTAMVDRLRASGAAAVLAGRNVDLPPDLRPDLAVVRVDDAELAMADALDAFAPAPDRPAAGVHPAAVVDPSATLGDGVSIGPMVTVGPRAVIGAGVILHPGTHVGSDAVIGDGSELGPNVTVGARCQVGRICRLHAGVVIGTDGFNYRPRPDGRGLRKITHVGNVVLGDDVELGAGTCVDRGKFGSTRIGDGSKLDNLVQVGHNAIIGRSAVLVAGVMIGGSVELGDGVQIGGQAAVRDHVKVGAMAQIGGLSAVTKDVPAGRSVLGYPARDSAVELRAWAERLRLRRSKRDRS